MAKKAAIVKAQKKAVKAVWLQQQLTSREVLEGKHRQVYDRCSDRCKKIAKWLVVFVGCSNSPNSIVQNTEFKQFVEMFDPRFPVPSRTLLGKELDKVLLDVKANIHTYLSTARCVSLCADIQSKGDWLPCILGLQHISSPAVITEEHRVTLTVWKIECSLYVEHVRDDTVAVVMKECDILEHKVRVIVMDSMVAAFWNQFKTDQDVNDEEEAEDIEDVVDVEAGSWKLLLDPIQTNSVWTELLRKLKDISDIGESTSSTANRKCSPKLRGNAQSQKEE